MHLDQINWIAVIVAAVAHQAVGFVWYGVLFAKAWQAAVGRSDADVRASATRAFIVASIGALVMAAAFALLFTLSADRSVTNGVIWGAVFGVGFVGASAFINGAYEDRKPIVTILFAGYEIVALMVMGAILGAIK